MKGSIEERANQWICLERVGVSSKTIWTVMMRVLPLETCKVRDRGRFDVPHDCDDFSRCHRLLTYVPEWIPRMHEVALVFPTWTPIVAMWGELMELYEAGDYRGVWEKICSVRDQCMELDGWRKTGNGVWVKD